LDKAIILQELQFKATRSSGAGGQHVNKVATKIVLNFDLVNSNGLTPQQKERVSKKLIPRLTTEGILILQCDTTRSQHKNKEIVIDRFFEVLKEALVIPKKRRKTKPSRNSVEKRLKSKQKHASKKENRKKPKID